MTKAFREKEVQLCGMLLSDNFSPEGGKQVELETDRYRDIS